MKFKQGLQTVTTINTTDLILSPHKSIIDNSSFSYQYRKFINKTMSIKNTHYSGYKTLFGVNPTRIDIFCLVSNTENIVKYIELCNTKHGSISLLIKFKISNYI